MREAETPQSPISSGDSLAAPRSLGVPLAESSETETVSSRAEKRTSAREEGALCTEASARATAAAAAPPDSSVQKQRPSMEEENAAATAPRVSSLPRGEEHPPSLGASSSLQNGFFSPEKISPPEEASASASWASPRSPSVFAEFSAAADKRVEKEGFAALWRPKPLAAASPTEEAAESAALREETHLQPSDLPRPPTEAAATVAAAPRTSPAAVAFGPGRAEAAAATACPAGELNSAFVDSRAFRKSAVSTSHPEESPPSPKAARRLPSNSRAAPPQAAPSQRGSGNLSLVAPAKISRSLSAAAPVLHCGWLDKWTNLLSSWRPRYFWVMPGFCKYSTSKAAPVKEMFLLNHCVVRLCPHDPVRFEVDVLEQQTLFLRAASLEEKRIWYAAFKQGQRASLPPQRASRTTSSRPRKNEASSSSQPQQLPPTQAPSGGGQSPASSYVTPTSATSAVGGGGLTGIAGAVAAFASSRLRSFSGAAATATSVSAASSSSTPARPPPPPLPADGQEQEQRVFSKSASSSQATALNQPASRVATAAGESSPVGVPPSRAAALVGTDSRSGSLDRLEEGETEGSSLVLLMEAMIATREELQANSVEGHHLRLELVKLLEQVDSQQQLLQQAIQRWEGVVSDAYSQKRQLERSARWLAKKNYRLEQTQQRMLSLSLARGQLTAAEAAAAAAGLRIPGDVESSVSSLAKLESSSLTAEANNSAAASAAAAALAAVNREAAVFSSSCSEEDTEDAEFFDCQDADGETAGGGEDDLDRGSSGEGVEDASQGAALKDGVERRSRNVTLWSVLKDCIGRDLSRISIPVFFNEPTSFLQRQCEDLQYCDLLRVGSHFPRSVDRLLAVALFAASPYASAVGRTYKPFNPLLGETFEHVHRGFRFLSEQVGHHPPVTAYVVSAPEFECEGSVAVKNRFMGSSLEVTVPGFVRVRLPLSKEEFRYNRVKMLIHNVIWGKLWIEVDGATLVDNETTGDFAVLQFVRKGWMTKTFHHLRGIVCDSTGKPFYRLSGQWSSSIYVEEANAEATARKEWKVPKEVLNFRSSCGGCPGENSPDNQLDAVFATLWESTPWMARKLLWKPSPRPPEADSYYGFGYFTLELNELSSDYAAKAPPTDSRRRPDQRLYEEGNVDAAVEEKNRLEEKQRCRAAARERPRGEADYRPRWFKLRDDGTNEWIYKVRLSAGRAGRTGGYWEAREANDWKDCPDIF